MSESVVNFDPAVQRAKIHEIVDIILDGNGFGRRKCELTNDLPTLFLEFSGHVAWVEVRLCPDGWRLENNRDAYTDFLFKTDEPISDAKVESLRYAVAAALEGKED